MAKSSASGGLSLRPSSVIEPTCGSTAPQAFASTSSASSGIQEMLQQNCSRITPSWLDTAALMMLDLSAGSLGVVRSLAIVRVTLFPLK